ncbi:efflux RND transporter permease subunit [Planctobacterium marinum]|uniref:efflux RND transporter permease subunit n=1 Tax=Planctobacterium marinum TaxID=1631968 RepID=UPI001E3FBB9E|nr:CusA/CzcA family heavy metal efflux RND transporter [Planctobacterium marinum]MCC2607131.1 CusA/CzcA family heavy metal efflux RND transporter [Planctobacterium marinum]
MLRTLIISAVKFRLLVVLGLLVVILMAAKLLPKINLDAFPDVTNVQVTINTEAPGLASEEVEQLITYPIEAVMYALPDVVEVRSVSKTGLSGITVVFADDVDIYFARQLVFERLQTAQTLIPEGVGVPQMGPNTSGLGQVFQYLLLAEPEVEISSAQLRSLNDWVVKLLLMPVDGITDVLSFGGAVQQYQVNLNPTRLLSYGLQQSDVVAALSRNNSQTGGWYMNRGQEQLVIRGTGWLSHGAEGLAQIAQIPVATIEGVVIRVADVAAVQMGSEIRQGAVSMTRRTADGQSQPLGEVVSGIVLKRMGANTKTTIDAIEQRLALIQRALPEGVTIQPFYDQRSLIEAAVNTVVEALAMAFVLILVVLFLFLLNLSATLLVIISIPLALAIALMLMSYYGISANLMSLGGLAVAIGMLVDSSVVVVENIFRRLQHQETPSIQQQGVISQRVSDAVVEVAKPVLFATSIIILVFMPLFSFEGVEAKLFEPMAVSIILALLAAVFIALLVLPALATLLFRQGVSARPTPLLSALELGYRRAVQQVMRVRGWLLAAVLMLVVLSAGLLTQIGSEFAPELEEGTINLRVTLAPSANLETALDVAAKLEAQLLTFPEVSYALSRIGRAELGGDPEPVNNIEIYIGLLPVAQWTSARTRSELQVLMAQKLSVFPGLLLNFSQPIATRVDELLSGVKAQLAVKLMGPDLSLLATKGQQMEQLVSAIPGTSDVALEQIQGEAQLVVQPDRRQLSRYGIAVADLMAVVRDGLGGQVAGQIIKANERYDIYVRIDARYRQSPEDIEALRLLSPGGAWVQVGDVASVQIQSGPPQIRRDDVQRRVVVQANVKGRDMGSVVQDIQYTLTTGLSLPPGYSFSIGGQFENQQRAQAKLLQIIPISLLLITLLLYFAFNSMRLAGIILLNVPLAAIGGIWALYLSGQYLSVPASVGFITLFGLAVLNGVMMVDRIQRFIGDGQPLNEAILNGAVSRLRPVLMTALTSTLGLIPIVLSQGVGAEIQRPLATVILGGMFSATLLTLFILPVVYAMLPGRGGKLSS